MVTSSPAAEEIYPLYYWPLFCPRDNRILVSIGNANHDYLRKRKGNAAMLWIILILTIINTLMGVYIVISIIDNDREDKRFKVALEHKLNDIHYELSFIKK